MIIEGYMSGCIKVPSWFSIEFSEPKAYGVGDETRNIDWKLWVKQINIMSKDLKKTNI